MRSTSLATSSRGQARTVSVTRTRPFSARTSVSACGSAGLSPRVRPSSLTRLTRAEARRRTGTHGALAVQRRPR